MSKKYTILTLLLCLSKLTFAAQHALIVGINEYSHQDKLRGAVNDAQLLKKALRHHHVHLPDERVLLNAQATRTHVIQAWHKMVEQAKPGDTLIFTYSGHGGQESDMPPFDEKDGRDETLVLYQGRIIDDELVDLFAQASEYKILFLADSCHSGGLPRKGFCRSSRFAKRSYATKRHSPIVYTKGDEKETLSHVTFLTAVDTDNLKVCEGQFDGKSHGALSWFFAKALAGEADGNHNKRLERFELDDYLSNKIVDETEGMQTPKLRPRPDSQVVLRLQGYDVVTPAPPSNLPELTVKIKIENGAAPGKLKNVREVSANFDLRFVKKGETTEVYNHFGDQMTTVLSRRTHQWQQLIDKERLLQALATQFDMRLSRVRIELGEGNKLYQRGEELHFSIAPTYAMQGLNALTLFNLPGNGELQFLYPLEHRNHSLTIQQFPYILPPLRVTPPFGGDNLVAVLCTRPPIRLHKLLKNSAPFLPAPAQVVSALQKQRCQVGQKAFFTEQIR
ncbi:MAG: caspase family protein [Pseudomonadota bacterium]